ncbi:MAG: hypothetical protein EHM18_00870 [Acidobacteria bacterium]|nr:MAG: hypothetical protein EHM18_00870 [Acidobacteriota bacterium]
MKALLIGLVVLLTIAVAVQGEYVFFTPKGSYTVEVSLENSTFRRLPIYRNAITSLDVAGAFAVGGTSSRPGLSPYLFAVSLSTKELEFVRDLGELIPGQRAIQSGFGRGREGVLFTGTMPDQAGGSGHLLQVRVGKEGIDVVDLGTPVKGEGVFALAASREREELYGIAHPSGRFFLHELRTSRTQVFNETVPSRKQLEFLGNYALAPSDFLTRRLVLDRDGRVFGSMPVNRLFRFDPVSRRVDVISDELPEVWGRRPLGRVDAWAQGPDGMLYGGNAGDGQLFRLDPTTGHVTNLGKPIMMPRIKGLAFASDGTLYGVAGGEPGYTHLFRYNPADRGFVDLGNPRFTMTAPGIEQGIAWRGFQIGSVAASEDGKWIVLGEEEALSQLMVFPAVD